MKFDLTKLQNGKFAQGKYSEAKETRGWFIGDFLPDDHPCKTAKVEVQYAEHAAGTPIAAHYHEQKVEILIVLEGKVEQIVNDEKLVLTKGDYVFVDVNNVMSGKFLEDTKVIAIHSPSIPTDKISL